MRTGEGNDNIRPEEAVNTTEKPLMTVSEMRDLLGLKRTDSYWLVHKGVFETKQILGKMWIDRASFEKWYANQVKYHKVTGEEPGLELRAWSYSVRDVAQMLGQNESTVYAIIKRDHIETFLVDHWMRISKDVFERWYKGQDQYSILQKVNDKASDEPKTVTEAGNSGNDKRDIKMDNVLSTPLLFSRRTYYTLKEAAQEAGVTRNAISSWIRDGRISVKRIGRKAYISVQELADQRNNR